MNWNSWSDFFAMGGYGLYVWGSVIPVFGMMLGEVVALRMRSKSIRAQFDNTRPSSRISTGKRMGGWQ